MRSPPQTFPPPCNGLLPPKHPFHILHRTQSSPNRISIIFHHQDDPKLRTFKQLVETYLRGKTVFWTGDSIMNLVANAAVRSIIPGWSPGGSEGPGAVPRVLSALCVLRSWRTQKAASGPYI